METIHIDIAGRNYPLSIPSSEKTKVSAAATIVNDQVEKFRKQFEVEDSIDFGVKAPIFLNQHIILLRVD